MGALRQRIHFVSPRVKEMLVGAGVLVEYQVPYSPDLNLIEYLFSSVKNRIKNMSREDNDLIQGIFKSYLQMQIRLVGRDKKIAKGHFRKA